MKKYAMLIGTLSTAFLLSAAMVSAAPEPEKQIPVTISDNRMIEITLPDEKWEQVMEEDLSVITFSDGENEICINLYAPDAELLYTLPDDECEVMYATSFMTKDFTVISEGFCYADDEEVFDEICKAMSTIKIDKEIAKMVLAEITGEYAWEEIAEKTGALQVIVDENDNYRTIYEYTDGTWRDDNGNTYTTAYNRDGYFYDSKGNEYFVGSDIGDREPDVIVYGASGHAYELYYDGEDAALDAYGNPYQYAGDGGWIDYYGNHYYEGGYRDDYERNDYTADTTDQVGEYITSVDGITRYVYWQNEFYAIDDDGNEYIFSGYDGTLRSSDGLEF